MERHANPEDPDLYALGALDGEEKQAYEAHVRVCPACARELEAAQQRAALLGLAAPPVAPPPSLRQSLMQKAREARPPAAAPVSASVSAPAPERIAAIPPRRRLSWLTPAFAVAALVFAALTAWLWTLNRGYVQQLQSLQAQLSQAELRTQEMAATRADFERMVGSPETIHVALASQPGGPAGRAGVLYNPRTGTVVYTGQLPPVPADKSYQLWLVPAKGAPVSLGVFSSSEETASLTSHVAPGVAAKAFAVTVEPEGGRPQPTGPKVLVGVAG